MHYFFNSFFNHYKNNFIFYLNILIYLLSNLQFELMHIGAISIILNDLESTKYYSLNLI